MANQSPDFPTGLHNKTDISAFALLPLGATNPGHPQVEGKQEEELYEIQKKLGIGDSAASEATTGAFLKKLSNGNTKWMQDYVSVKDFGAVGDGSVDDTLAIQEGVDSAINNGNVLIFPEGRYLCGLITIEDASLHIMGFGNVTIIQKRIGYRNGVFQFRGGFTNITDVDSISTVSVALNDTGESSAGVSRITQLILNSTLTTVKGDLLKIVADDINPWMDDTGTSEKNRVGEYSLAAENNNDATLNLSNRLLLNDSFTTNIRVAKVPDYRFSIENINFEVTEALRTASTVEFGAVIHLAGGRDHMIKNCTFKNSLGIAILLHSYNARVEECRFTNLHNKPSKSRYGYGVDDLGWNTRMHDCHGENVRHIYTNGNDIVGADSDYLEYYGEAVGAIISQCTGLGNQGSAFDTHSGCYGIQFIGCTAIGSFVGASSGGAGFNVRGRNVTLQNCDSINCFTGIGVGIIDGLYINNCKVFGSYYSTMSFGADAASNGVAPYNNNIIINDSYFESKYDGSNQYNHTIIGNNVYPANNLTIRNSKFKFKGIASGARVFDLFQADITLENVIVDVSEYVTSGNPDLYIFNINDSSCNIKINELKVIAGAAGFSTDKLRIFKAPSSSNASPIQFKDILATQDTNRIMLVSSTDFSNFKGTWEILYSTTILNSKYIAKTAAAAAVIDISQTAEQSIFVKLTGSAGAVTLTDIASGYKPGQMIHIYNASNGAVTMATPSFTVNSGAGVGLMWDGTAWRILYVN